MLKVFTDAASATPVPIADMKRLLLDDTAVVNIQSLALTSAATSDDKVMLDTTLTGSPASMKDKDFLLNIDTASRPSYSYSSEMMFRCDK